MTDQPALDQEQESDTPTPFGMLRYAEQYRLAGERVIGNCKPHESKFLMPAYNNMAISLELGFKAFLLAKGIAYQTLRFKPYGHDLEFLMADARAKGLELYVPLSSEDAFIVSTVAAPYKAHEFRYIKYGFKTLPFWEWTSDVAKKLTHGLHDYCYELRVGREAAQLRISSGKKFGLE